MTRFLFVWTIAALPTIVLLLIALPSDQPRRDRTREYIEEQRMVRKCKAQPWLIDCFNRYNGHQ